MGLKNIGSSFDDFLDEEGIKEEVDAAVIKRMVSEQLLAQMHKSRITKARMAKLMRTSRASLDRLLDPQSKALTLLTLSKAAKVLGLDLSIRLAG